MTEDTTRAGWSRRRLLQAGSAGALAPAVVRSAYARGEGRPLASWGAQAGDVRSDSAVIWARSDRDARMQLRWSTRPDLADAVHSPWVHALRDRDHTAKLLLAGLPAGERIHYEIVFTDLADLKTRGEPLRGSFRTAPASAERNVRFLWSGDTAGQGWGINPDIGGMRIYDRMRALQPDFFIHYGDTVYADSPIEKTVKLADGRTWRNLVTPQKSKVAESLDEFRGQYRYNLLDDPLRQFNAEVPMYAQWDDHEVTNNWYWEMRRGNCHRSSAFSGRRRWPG